MDIQDALPGLDAGSRDMLIELADLGFELIAGVDEVGRGALAGPVVAAACILPPGFDNEAVRDSKLVPEDERDELYDIIVRSAVAWSVGAVSEQEIDRINILQATFVAMRQAIAKLRPAADYVLIDGRDALDIGAPCTAIVDGDAMCRPIAAASILAKVTRDRIMRGLDVRLPAYGFARHKGYATAAHRRAILEHGVSSVHRMSFLGRLLRPADEQIGFEDVVLEEGDE